MELEARVWFNSTRWKAWLSWNGKRQTSWADCTKNWEWFWWCEPEGHSMPEIMIGELNGTIPCTYMYASRIGTCSIYSSIGAIQPLSFLSPLHLVPSLFLVFSLSLSFIVVIIKLRTNFARRSTKNANKSFSARVVRVYAYDRSRSDAFDKPPVHGYTFHISLLRSLFCVPSIHQFSYA